MPASTSLIDLQPGEYRAIRTDHPTIDGFHVQRMGSTYGAWVNIPVGDVLDLFGAQGMTLDQFVATVSGPRWTAAGHYLEQRYGSVMLDGALQDQQAVVVVGHDFQTVPTEEQVVAALWETAAILREEADPQAEEWISTGLREYLDSQAFLSPSTPLPDEDTVSLNVLLAATTGEPMSDGAAAGAAAKLAGPQGPPCYTDLRNRGYADREELTAAVDQVPEEKCETAQALAVWAQAQPSTSRLLGHAQEVRQG